MSNKFNWGLIGPGRIAHRFAKGLEVIDNTKLYAVASNNRERADYFAKEYSIENSYYSYKELALDENIDAVYIATPHRFHFENTKLCLENNKHVLCEKPFTVNSNEAKILIDLANKNNLFLMEALWTRFLPIYGVVKSWLEEGLIGEVKLMNSNFGFNIPRNLNDRLLSHDLAGGTLLDMGIYPIAISQWVMGENPKSFSTCSIIGETNVDELTSVNFQYNNGAVSQFSTNFLARTINDFIIYGTKGNIKIHEMFWSATKATLTTQSTKITETRELRATGFEYQTEEVMNCIKGGKIESEKMPLIDTMASLKLMDAIRKEIGLKYNFE